MTPGDDIRTELAARAILRLAADAPPSALRAAFQREVKAAHPDRGGDTDRVRQVIEAYRFLKSLDAAVRRVQRPGPRPTRPGPRTHAADPPPPPEPPASPPPEPEVHTVDTAAPHPPRFPISIVEAFHGCDKPLRIAQGRRFKVRLPPGLRSGDVVRFGDAGEHSLVIEVTAQPGVALKGADLWLTVAVSPEFVREGGRMEVDTPFGHRRFWVSRTSAARGLYRVPGEGLPAGGDRPKGHLYLKFELDERLGERPAKSLLARFAAAWAGA